METNATPTFWDYLKNNWGFLAAVIVAIATSYIAFSHIMQPLLEKHSFRQTQTALTSYWMLQNGWEFAYETPVGGYPWKLPFEFPIYQAIVAFISSIFNAPLTATGRAVSFVFLLAYAWPAVQIGRKLALKKEVAWVFCILVWTSPLYLFWGRTFMIETSALFFALVSINYALDFLKEAPSLKSALLFLLFATLGMLQKVTTVAPVLLIMSFVILVDHLKTHGFKLPSLKKSLLVFFSFLIPIVLALLWVRFTDTIKSESLFGNSLTSKSLSWWNYGTLAQRTDLEILKTIFWERVIVNNIAGFIGLFILLIAFIFGNKSNRKFYGLNLLFFVLPIFIFMNLHKVHDYYQTASTCFLIASLAIAITNGVPKYLKKIPVTPILLILLVSFNLSAYSTTYQKLAEKEFDPNKHRALILEDIIGRYTDKNSSIVVFGHDWSSEIPFYTKRKSFAVPNWFKSYDSVRKNPEKFTGDLKLGAVVFIQNDTLMPALKLRQDILQDSSLYVINSNCYLWLPKQKAIPSLSDKTGTIPYKNAYLK